MSAKLNTQQIKYISSIVSSFLNELKIGKQSNLEAKQQKSNKLPQPIIDLGNGYKFDLNLVEKPEPFNDKDEGKRTQEAITLDGLIDEFIENSTYKESTDKFISTVTPQVLAELLKLPANFKEIQTLNKIELDYFLNKKLS